MDLPPELLSTLSTSERVAFRLGRLVNESDRLKSVAHWWSQSVSSRWLTLVSSRRIHLDGIEKMAALRPDRGVLLASNHRSFFDMYMVSTYLDKHTDLCQRFYFPVRSAFWYDKPIGVALNAGASAMSMFPPVFRESEKRELTRLGLDFLAGELARPGTVVGIHPEGRRGKGPDPYELLPAEQGFGRVALSARPIVIPIFINGMTNDFLAEVRGTFDGTGIPVIIVFGDPVDLTELYGADPTRLRSQIDVSRKVLTEIAKLAQRERAIRAELGRG